MCRGPCKPSVGEIASLEFAHSFLGSCRVFAWVRCIVWTVGDDIGLIARTQADFEELIMKKTLVALALAAVIPVAAYAAMEGKSGHTRGDRVERMSEVLNLDDSQRDLMKKMFEEQRAERKAMRAQMRARMDEILTPEQRVKRDELREQRRENRRERSGKRGRRHHQHQKDCGEEKSS